MGVHRHLFTRGAPGGFSLKRFILDTNVLLHNSNAIFAFGKNRVVIGLVKRLHLRDELIDPTTLRIHSDRFKVIGRMASPNWYCRTTDRFEVVRPK